MSFREYQQKKLLERAMVLLNEKGKISEKEVAAELGYTSLL